MPQEIEAFHTHEYFEFISQVGFLSLSTARELFSMPEVHPADSLQTYRQIALAKIRALEGDILLADDLLTNARNQLNRSSHPEPEEGGESPAAYLAYESCVFDYLVENPDRSAAMRTEATRLARSDWLRTLLQYMQDLARLEQNTLSGPIRIQRHIQHFASEGHFVMQALALHQLAEWFRKRGEYEECLTLCEQALAIAREHGYDYIHGTVENTLALSLGSLGKLNEARLLFIDIISRVESHYLQTLSHTNLGLIEYELKNYEASREALLTALSISDRQHVVSIQPTILAFLAELEDQCFQDKQQAAMYFRLVRDEVYRLQKRGFSVTGTRYQALKKALAFFEHEFTELTIADAPVKVPRPFEFAIDREWVWIKDIFHYNLFAYHYLNHGIGPATLKALNVPTSTFYSTLKRMRERGIFFPDFRSGDAQFDPRLFNVALQRYLKLHAREHWREINRSFERDIYAFLYKQYNYNKRSVAKKLGLAYNNVVQKTRYLTDPQQEQPGL